MSNQALIRSRCSSAAIDVELPIALVLALADIMLARGPVQAMACAAQVPDHLLPALAWHCSRRNVEPSSIKVLLDMAGRDGIRRTLGNKKAKQILMRYG